MVRVHGRSIPMVALAEVLGLEGGKLDAGEKQTVLVIPAGPDSSPAWSIIRTASRR